MNFFKVRKLRKAYKPNVENNVEDKPVRLPEEPKNENGEELGKSTAVETASEGDDDDDDFIINEVKMRLKELRRNSFMVLIPEESCPDGEEEEEEEQQQQQGVETISSEGRDIEAEGRQFWSGYDAVYEKYCEGMLFFDRLSAQQLKEIGSYIPTPSPKSASKKLASHFQCLSLKKFEEPEDEKEHLQQPEHDPRHDLETAYVSQLCLTWEALHCQYTQLSQLISCQPENPTSYNHSAQQFQQFQVLLQRFIEDEPFEQGMRAEIFAQRRGSLPNLLQVPIVKGSDQKRMESEDSDIVLHASDLIKIIESAILTFHLFLKTEKKRYSGGYNIFGSHNSMTTPLQQIQSSLDKRWMKLRDLRKKSKGWKKRSWPTTQEDVELLFGLTDFKVMLRVLRMAKISKEQLFWCEEKMKKLDFSDGKLLRNSSPVPFPT